MGCVNLQDLLARLSVRESKQELPVEAAGPPQRWVNGVQPVSGADHHNLTAGIQAVHQNQQRGHDGAVDVVLPAGANWSQAVNLIEEDDGGSHEVRLFKQQAELPL